MQTFERKWIVKSATEVEIFLIVSIRDMPTMKYWKTLERIRVHAK